MDEIIVVAPRTNVFENEELTFQGIMTDKEVIDRIVNNIANSYSEMRRGDAEENPNYKQPIPYCVIKRGNEVFMYKRLSAGGETRLHDSYSVGVGGHLNNIPKYAYNEVVLDGLQRELEEELIINTDNLVLDEIGLINDDVNEVGRVHIGILTVGEIPYNEEVSVRETDQLEGEWIAIQDLVRPDIYEKLESWSKFVANVLNK